MSTTKNSFYGFLASLKLTIFLLSFIAAASVFGTVIAQRAGVEHYLSVYSESTYRIIHFFGLDDTFHSPWFLAAILLFAVNLTLCTVGRLSRFLKSEKDTPSLPEEQVLSAMQMHFASETSAPGKLIDTLKAGYKTVREDDEGLVLEKGAIARYGVYIIHASILVILIGSLIGFLFGYRGSVVLHKGEAKERITLRGGNIREIPLGFTLKCNDFKVSFYPSGEPKEYVSRLEVIENGKPVLEKEIRVNHPLSYKGVYVYQASYGSAPSFLFSVGGKDVVVKEGDTYEKDGLTLMIARFEHSVHDFGPGVLLAYMDQGGPKTSWFLNNIERLKERDIRGVKIRLKEIREDFYTGLEVARDPGTWVVWTGFALILFGLYVNFFMYYRRIYIRRVGNGLLVAGVAFRNKEAFRDEFEKIKRKASGQ